MNRPMHQIRLAPDSAPLDAALTELSALSERFPDVVQRFLDGLLELSELVRINSVDGAAETTGDLRVLFEPSERLREFLAAARTGNVD